MVWSPGAVACEFRNVPQRLCFSILFSILKYQLKQSLCITIKFVEFTMDFKNGEFNLTMSE